MIGLTTTFKNSVQHFQLDWVYLDEFSRNIPGQNENDARGEQIHEIHKLPLLSQFYWLINQKVKGEDTLQDNDWFRGWIDRYAKSLGYFLDSPESFNQDILNIYINDKPKYKVEDSMIQDHRTKTKRPNSPSGWLTFNQFFARSLNPGLRPIEEPMDNSIVTSPADCFFRAKYAINSESNIPEIIMKRTHKYSSIKKILEGSHYANDFANGTFVHYYLAAYSYHRLHFPVSGTLKESYVAKGYAYSNPQIQNNEFHDLDTSQGGYEFTQARGILTIDTTDSPYGNIGIIAVIPVGMSLVSSVNLTAQPNKAFLKGDEFGYFLYGGSDIIVLFQKEFDPKIDENNQYRHYGTKIANCSKIGVS